MTVTFVCRLCGTPIETVPIEGGVEWRCPSHGMVGVRLDGGTLDLGIIRDEAAAEPWPFLFTEENDRD